MNDYSELEKPLVSVKSPKNYQIPVDAKLPERWPFR